MTDQVRPPETGRVRSRSFIPWLVVLVALAINVGSLLSDPEPVGATILVVVSVLGVAAAFWMGRRGRHTPYAQARDRIADGHAVVLWKPGCVYCENLMRRVGSDPAVTWVNVYEDAEADAAVRAVNNGDQLTPTALVGERVLRNPSAGELRAAL